MTPKLTMNPNQMDYILDLSERLKCAKHGEKGKMVDAAAAFLDRDRVVVYRWLREVGVGGKERKTRSDAGMSRVSGEELRLVAGLVRVGTRANGKETITMGGAIEMARSNGVLKAEVSDSTISRQLYRQGMHPEQLRRATPHAAMASRHPNHFWQIDTSVCVLYYLERDRLGVMDEKVFYKNKMENIYKIKDQRILRVKITDHYSHMFYLRYLLGGESAENLITALIEAMLPREDDPFCGAPFMLGMDPGAANKSRVMQVFLRNMDIKPLVHKVANSRANGSVEVGHNIVETHFEGRLKIWPTKIDCLETLNREATRWRLSYCGRAIHGRHGRTRMIMWATIADEQKRVPTSLALLREAATSEPEQVTVYGDYSIKYKGCEFDVRHIPEAAVNGVLLASVNIFRFPAMVNIHGGDGKIWLAEKIQRNAAGFREDAAVWGEDYKSFPDGAVDKNRKKIDEEALGPEKDRRPSGRQTPYGGRIDPMADVQPADVPEVVTGVGHQTVMPEIVTPPKRVAARLTDRELEASDRVFASLAMAQNKPQLLDGAGRPVMTDDAEWAKWLVEHPDQILSEDRVWLRNKMRNPVTRTLLDAVGVDLELAKQLVA